MEIGSNIEIEVPKWPHEVGIIFGQHANGENIAAAVGQRLKSIFAGFPGVHYFEHPAGGSYTDAFLDAAKEADLHSAAFGEKYHSEMDGRTQQNRQEIIEFAKQHPDIPIIDIHESCLRDFPSESVSVHVNKDTIDPARLKELATAAFPAVRAPENKYLGFLLSVEDLAAAGFKDENNLPPNYIVVEIYTPPELYDFPADSSFLLRGEGQPIRTLKPLDSVSDKAAYQAEVTKYTRILERIIPAIEMAYREKKLVKP